MGMFISVDDLEAFVSDLDETKVDAMIADAEALALLAAPCLGFDDFSNTAAVRAVLRGAVLRWLEAGTGALQSQSAGPYAVTYDTRQDRRTMFWPSEITQLRSLCTGGTGPQKAFNIDTMPLDQGYGYWSQPDTWVPLVWP